MNEKIRFLLVVKNAEDLLSDLYSTEATILTTRFYAVFRILKFKLGVYFYIENGMCVWCLDEGTHFYVEVTRLKLHVRPRKTNKK